MQRFTRIIMAITAIMFVFGAMPMVTPLGSEAEAGQASHNKLKNTIKSQSKSIKDKIDYLQGDHVMLKEWVDLVEQNQTMMKADIATILEKVMNGGGGNNGGGGGEDPQPPSECPCFGLTHTEFEIQRIWDDTFPAQECGDDAFVPGTNLTSDLHIKQEMTPLGKEKVISSLFIRNVTTAPTCALFLSTSGQNTGQVRAGLTPNEIAACENSIRAIALNDGVNCPSPLPFPPTGS